MFCLVWRLLGTLETLYYMGSPRRGGIRCGLWQITFATLLTVHVAVWYVQSGQTESRTLKCYRCVEFQALRH